MIYYWFPFKFPFLLGLTSFYFTPTCINPSYRSFFPLFLASNFKHFLHRKQVTLFFLKTYLKKYKGHRDFRNIFWQPTISEFTSEQTVRQGAEMPTWPLWSLWAKPLAYLISPGNEVVDTYSGYLIIRCFICQRPYILCLVLALSVGFHEESWVLIDCPKRSELQHAWAQYFRSSSHFVLSPAAVIVIAVSDFQLKGCASQARLTELLRTPSQEKAGCG